MDEGFIDLDVLLLRIRNSQSKVYLLDAVKAYKAGALRASITSIWVALVYDLISKYRELSAAGDAAATAFTTRWDNATALSDTRTLLQLERDILDDATNVTQIINTMALVQLQRIRDDRHLCAHPAFSTEAELFEPTSELVRLHLVNAVNLILSREPLQGTAILNQFGADVQTPGFPTDHDRILDYVEQRYLSRVRPQNIRNFGVVLAKSLLKGTPPELDPYHTKIVSSLIALRERSGEAWPDLETAIVRLVDNLEPEFRARAISFVAAVPGFWPQLQDATRTALIETATNTDPGELEDYRILGGVSLEPLRAPILHLIAGLTRSQLGDALSQQALPELWDRAIEVYAASGGYRSSERNFLSLIAPFVDHVDASQLDQLLNAISNNGQNWDAADTDSMLLSFLNGAWTRHKPSHGARDQFWQQMRRMRRLNKYDEVFALFQSDGWATPAPQDPEGDED